MPQARDDTRVLTPALPLADSAYRALLDAMPGMVFTTDARGVVDYINQRFADYAGTSVGALRDGAWEPIIHPDDRAASAAEWARAMAAGEAGEIEHRVRAHDGGYRWFRTRIAPLLDGAEAITGWLGIATEGLTVDDVGGQKSREEALRAEYAASDFRARLTDALRQISDPGAVAAEAARLLREHLDADRVVYGEAEADPDWFHLTGDASRDGSSVAGRYRFAGFGAVADIYRGGATVVEPSISAQPALSDADRGAYRAMGIEAHISVPVMKEGRLAGVLGVQHATRRAWTTAEVALAEEVAERTWAALAQAGAEASVRDGELRYRALFDSIDEGYCLCEMILDADGKPDDYRFLEVNPHFSEMTGIQLEAIGRTARDLVPGLEDWWVETYGRVALTGEPARFEQGSVVMGRMFDVFVTRVPPAEALRFAIVFRDITARKRAEHAQQMMLRAGEALQTTLDRDTMLDQLVTLPVPDLADMVAVYRRAEDGEITQVLGVGAGGERAFEQALPGDRGIIARVFDTGEPFFAPHVTEDVLAGLATSPEHLAMLRAFAPASLAYVPMLAHGSIVGVYGAGTRSPRKMDENGYATVQEIARRAGLALDNAQLTAESGLLHERTAEAQSTLTSILQHAPVGIVYLGLDGRYQHINPSLAAMNGIPAAEHIGRHVSEIVPDLWPKVAVIFDRIRAGEDEITFDLTGTTAATGAIEHTWRETWYAVRVAGALSGVAAIVDDITEQLRLDRHQSVRVAISELKNQPLDDEAIARGAIATLVPELADWAAVYALCDDGTIERTALSLGDARAASIERETHSSADATPDVARRAMRHGEVTLVTEIEDGVLVTNALTEAHLEQMRSSGFLSGMTVPTFVRGRIAGAISLATTAESGRRLDERDVAFAREAASRIGAAIESARLQRDLARSGERYRRLIEASPAMVFETEASGAFLWASTAFWDYTGLEENAPDSLDWKRQRLVHPDDEPDVERRWAQSIETGAPFEAELRVRAVDGTYRWFLNRLVAQHAPDGTITGWVGTGTDIHDRVMSEDLMSEALDGEQEARVLLDAVLQSAPVAVTVIDRALRWIHINETAARFNGFTVEEHLAARVPDLLPEVWRDVEPIYRTIFETGEPLLGVELELPTPGTSNEVRSWSASYFPVSRDGKVFAVAAMYADVTDRRRAEVERERLLEDVQQANAETQDALSRERSARLLLDTVLQSAPIGIVILDTQLRFVRVNEALAAMNGASVEAHIGKRPSEMVAKLGPLVEPHFQRALDTGAPELGIEIEAATPADPDGPHWWRFNFFPIIAANGERVGVAATRTDITREMHEGIERERLVAELQRANATKDEFLGLVSHELKTPITTIYGNAQVLMNRNEQLSERDRAGSVADIAYESERLHRIIDNLLVLARLDRGAAINTEPVLVSRTAQRIAREHQVRFPARSIRVSEDGGEGFVLAEPVYIEQVLRNLVSNAEKYSPAGTAIDIAVTHHAGTVEVAVRDRGAGFTEEEAAQMFSPFYRAPTSAKVASGIGIGLAVCKRLIEAQGGDVWARPRDGGGADIGFSLPLADE